MNILGISAFYHDSAAALIKDGTIIAAAQEERFTRKKHDDSFPIRAVAYCLAEGGIGPDQLDAVAFYDKPLLKFERIFHTYLGVAPRGLRSFMQAAPAWLKQKLWIPLEIETRLAGLGITAKKMYFPEHHESHAASAFFPSPFETAAVLTMDGVGEWTTSSIGFGDGHRLSLLKEQTFPHSLGLLYSAFTYFTGFRVNSGEYKLMGLAPYGEPVFYQTILDHLLDLKTDGSFRLNMAYFGYLDGLTMTNRKFAQLFGGPPRKPESEITQRERNLACSIQKITEEIVLRSARYARQLTGTENVCLAGGVALNCVANGRLLREGPFKQIWIQPAAGDAGGALGAALYVHHHVLGNPRRPMQPDAMSGALLGPDFNDTTIAAFLEERGYPAKHMTMQDKPVVIAQLIAGQHVIGLCQGRMEFGPRALGNRSIIGDARSPKMQSIMNLKIKYRESFRPFAPACLEEEADTYFVLDRPSPYMLLVAQVQPGRCRTAEPKDETMLEQLHAIRSDIPAVTHVDYSARVQTVSKKSHPDFHAILEAFKKKTGEGIVINTSFNVRGEPIVCTPEDAYRCFIRTEMDYLVLGSYLLDKKDQPEWREAADWRIDYVLD